MSDSRLDKGLGKTSLTLVWNKMKAYVNSFMGTVDAKFNTLSVDYVVEQGNDGTWTYQKWNSGITECWGYFGHTPTATGSSTFTVTLPFAFVDSYFVQITPARNGTLITQYGDYNSGGNVTHTTTSFDMTYNISKVYGVAFHIHVIGKWK